jgi:hypothetical protein
MRVDIRRLEPLAFVVGAGLLYFGVLPAACAYAGARGLWLKVKDARR